MEYVVVGAVATIGVFVIGLIIRAAVDRHNVEVRARLQDQRLDALEKSVVSESRAGRLEQRIDNLEKQVIDHHSKIGSTISRLIVLETRDTDRRSH